MGNVLQSERTRLLYPLDAPDLSGNEEKYLKDAIASGWLSWQGPYVRKFEASFASYVGSRFALTCSSGTAALQLALLALGIGKGDEVIVPALTFQATAAVVSFLGARVVFADSLPGKFNVDPHDIQKKLTSRTKALVVVHLYGWPAEMNGVMEIARKRNVPVIEDCAQAIGTQYCGKIVGGIGTIGCFSFHNKQIATGEGGMITTHDERIARRMALIRTPSPNNEGDFTPQAFNFRMSNLHAAVGAAQLERVAELVGRRRQHASLYNRLLSDVEHVSLFHESSEERCSYWRYNLIPRISQKKFVEQMTAAGIGCRPVYRPLHQHPHWAGRKERRLLNAEGIAEKAVDLPSSPILGEEDIRFIVSRIREVLS